MKMKIIDPEFSIVYLINGNGIYQSNMPVPFATKDITFEDRITKITIPYIT